MVNKGPSFVDFVRFRPILTHALVITNSIEIYHHFFYTQKANSCYVKLIHVKLILLHWFNAQQQTSTFRRQKSDSFYLKFSAEWNELIPSFSKEQDVP